MALVTLTRAWLTDISSGVSLQFLTTARSDNRATPGEIRRYANGVLRSVTQGGRVQTLGITAVALSAADIVTLDGWATGRLLLFRDVKGRKLYGTSFAIDVKDYTARNSDVTFVLSQVSYSEAV